MNLLEIRTEIRRILAETTAASSYFSDADINRFINDGIKHMCIEAGVYEKTIPISVVNGDATYTLPLEFISMKTLLNQSKIPLDPIVVSQVGSVYLIDGKPLNYYMTQGVVTLNVWTVATPYTIFPPTCLPLSTYIRPTTANGFTYECVVSGSSHATTEPTWGLVLGTRLADAAGVSLTWACRELFSTLYTLNLYSTPTILGGGVGAYTAIFSAMDEGLYVDTDVPNFPWDKHHYLVLYGSHRCALKAKDLQLAMAFLADYSAGLGLKVTAPGGEGGEGGPQG
jgi:hypothetical protein